MLLHEPTNTDAEVVGALACDDHSLADGSELHCFADAHHNVCQLLMVSDNQYIRPWERRA
jgi:hypothetical protein